MKRTATCVVTLGGLFLLMAAAAAYGATPPALEHPVAIRDARIVVEPGRVIEKGTLVIRNGRIAAVGAGVAIPAGARVIDGTGKTAYAGFIDGFSRAGVSGEARRDADDERRIEGEFPDIGETAQNETPVIRSGIFATRRVEDVLKIDEKTFNDQRQAGFTTALLAPPRALLGGTASLVALGDRPLRDSVLRAEVAQTASFERPARRNLLDRSIYPGTLLGVSAHLRQVFSDARWYAEAQRYAARNPGSAASVSFDADLAALAAVEQGRLPLLWEANRADEIRRALEITREFGLPIAIAGGRYAWQAADGLQRREIPVVLSLAVPGERRDLKPAQRELGNALAGDELFDKEWNERAFYPARAYEEAERLRKDAFENALRLSEDGVRWCFSTIGLSKPGDALVNVNEFIRHGLSHDVALQALTVAPAEIFGVSARLGTLTEGKLGNVTLLSAPLGEKDCKVVAVVIGGKVFENAKSRGGKKKGDSDADSPESDSESESESGEESSESEPSSENESSPASDDAETQPAPGTQPDAAPRLVAEWPIETDADRRPALRLEGDVLLENALVLTITNGDLDDTSVLVRDGKIAAIGRGLSAPDGVRRVDLKGYVLMPGMFDPHSHLALDGINEWSLSVTPEVRCGDVLRSDDPGIYWALSGGVTAMHNMHGSANSIGGQNVIIKCRYGRPASEMLLDGAPRTVKFATGENVKRPGTVDLRWDRNTPRRFPGTRMGVEATVRRALAAGKRYAAEREAARVAGEPFRHDLRLEALADILAGDIWINAHCYRAEEILRLLDTAEHFGVRVAVLHHVLEGYRIMPEIARHGSGTATFADWWAYKVEAYDAVPHNAAMLLRAGVASALKSDSGDLIRHMNLEAAKAVRFGDLSPNDALKLVTINAVRLFGLEDRLGSIEVGKDADLAVFDGHPLDTFSRCVLTLVDGEAYFVHPDFDPEQPRKPRAVRDFTHAGRDWSDVKGKTAQTINVRRPGPGENVSRGPGRYAIINATVHPVSGPPMRDAVVLIDGARIAAVGKVTVPAGYETIDATGLHVYPGLINAATTIGLQEIEQVTVTMDTSEPGTYHPDVLAISAFNPHSAMIEVTRAEGVTTCVVIPGGARVAGQAGVVHLDGWTLPEMLHAERVGLVVTLPTQGPKGVLKEESGDPNEDDSPRSRRGRTDFDDLALRNLERFIEQARLYADALDAGDKGLRRDPRYDEMVAYVRGQRPVLFRAGSVKEIVEAVAFARRYELRPVILGGRDAWKLADYLAAESVPVIFEGVFGMPRRLPDLGNASDVWDGSYRSLATLQAAGVKFCTAYQGADLAKNMPFDVGFAVAHGLAPDAALRAMTLSAAEILGMEKDLGSIEAGKLANLIITTDHPSQMTGQVRQVFIQGRPVELASKHTRDMERFEARPSPSLPPERRDLKGPPSMTTR